MKKVLSLFLSIVMLIGISVGFDSNGYYKAEAADKKISVSDYAADRVIITFSKNVNRQTAQKILNSEKQIVDYQTVSDHYAVATLSDNVSVENAVDTLEKNGSIENVEPDYIRQVDCFTNDTEISSSKYSSNKDKYHYIFKMKLAGSGTTAWNYINGSGVKVAVLDSGANINHNDLKNNVAGCYNAVTKREGKAYVTDHHGHGSKAAGIICATGNNKTGAAGVAYGAKLYVVKVADDDDCIYSSYTAEGIRWAVDQGCRVISISYGGEYYSDVEAQAIEYAYDHNVVVVCSGGNTSSGEYHYPASYPGAFAVSALDYSSGSGYSILSSSTYNDKIDIAAPGKALYGVSNKDNKSLASLGKTSAAAPYVAGVAALVLSADRTISAKKCMDIITSTATDKGASGYDKRYGYGIINPLSAVKKAAKKTVTLSTASYVYNGKIKTPSVTVKDRNSKILKKDTDYTVTYASGRKNVGKYSVKVKFKGKYRGTVTKTFKIKPKNTNISKVTAKSKSFTVKWKKYTTQTTGYQIQYSTSSKFTSGTTKKVTVSKNSTTSKTINKLKSKKKYYVRIRTYKTVSGTKYYSSWSSTKSVTTKK